jgi:hypothetical protein
VPFHNQVIWGRNPDKAKETIAEALATGGFDTDCIKRRVGNYEGQIMAIRDGLVDRQGYAYRINDAGRAFLSAQGKPVPTFLTVLDSWHSSDAEYCMFETTCRDQPVLRFAQKIIPQGAYLCMDPLFRRQDVEALRDYLSAWLARL